MDDPLLDDIGRWHLWQRLVIGLLLGIWWTISGTLWEAFLFSLIK